MTSAYRALLRLQLEERTPKPQSEPAEPVQCPACRGGGDFVDPAADVVRACTACGGTGVVE